MENLILYLKLGWEHIVSPDATDHILFLLALVVPFVFRDWKKILVLITAFTLGHCLTLALSSTGTIRFSSFWIELLIPCTIFLTAVFQLIRSVPESKSTLPLLSLYSMAGLFGLIHGLGFANTLKSMLGREQSILVPLAGFNLGIEFGQIAVLLLLLLVREGFRILFPGAEKAWLYSISTLAAIGSLWMIWDRI